MNIAKEILQDSKVIDLYKQISQINKTTFDHGIKHVNNVYKIMEKLCDVFEIDQLEREALLIAVALHDVGQVDGRDNHGYKSMLFAKDYLLKYKDYLGKYYDLILQAIEYHSSKEIKEESIFFLDVLRFADKMDFTRDRVVNYDERYIIYTFVSSVDFIKDEHNFALLITTTKDGNEKMFFEEVGFFPKVVRAIMQFTKRINKKYKIIINNKDVTKKCNELI